ncbi:hypothetical protein CP8484711_2048B, partial [Chlamydia psittaci 84-8471/1]
SQANSIP